MGKKKRSLLPEGKGEPEWRGGKLLLERTALMLKESKGRAERGREKKKCFKKKGFGKGGLAEKEKVLG